MRHLLFAQMFLSLVFLIQQHRGVVSRSSRKLVLPENTRVEYDENIKTQNLKGKRKKIREILDASVKPSKRSQEDFSCDCSNFCLDPHSSELKVSMELRIFPHGGLLPVEFLVPRKQILASILSSNDAFAVNDFGLDFQQRDLIKPSSYRFPIEFCLLDCLRSFEQIGLMLLVITLYFRN